jgi:hypothetical protein
MFRFVSVRFVLARFESLAGMFAVSAAAIAISAGEASAVTIVNGGLESTSAGTIQTVTAGNSANRWRATLSDIEFVKNGFAGSGDVIASAQDGEWFVDLNGVSGPGGIGQDIATDPGQLYRIDFWMSGNAGPLGTSRADGSRSLDVLWNNAVVGSFTFVFQPGDRWNNLRWEKHSVLVTGASGLDSLEIRSTSSFYAAAGPFVDAITITAVPEPGTWAMLTAGLGLVGFGVNRRSKR